VDGALEIPSVDRVAKTRQKGKLTYFRLGRFSGSAISLKKALEPRVRLTDFDLVSLGRRPGMLTARLLAMGEAAQSNPPAPWLKTLAWSRAAQRAVARQGLLSGEAPLLFVQTLPAFVLSRGLRYAIYTDRVGREGAAVGGVHRSRFTQGWLSREESFLRGAHRVYVMGPSTKEVLEREYRIDASKVRVVGAGPNMPLGPATESDHLRRILFVGTQWELKGGPELLAAFTRARAEFPLLELTLVGSRPPGPLPEGVVALGRIPHSEMDAIYSRSDAVVIPTHMEAFGLSLLEGLMKGLPCIATPTGNQNWIVGDAGETVRPGDVDGLVGALRRLILEYPRYRSLAATRGRELRRDLNWDRVAASIVEDLL
jgi:glycosyltransferase involved in cell wall biosynthesis